MCRLAITLRARRLARTLRFRTEDTHEKSRFKSKVGGRPEQKVVAVQMLNRNAVPLDDARLQYWRRA